MNLQRVLKNLLTSNESTWWLHEILLVATSSEAGHT
jgi:hypothetical protein